MAKDHENQLIIMILLRKEFRPYDTEYNDGRIPIISVVQL
jgi:hypothetical protein